MDVLQLRLLLETSPLQHNRRERDRVTTLTVSGRRSFPANVESETSLARHHSLMFCFNPVFVQSQNQRSHTEYPDEEEEHRAQSFHGDEECDGAVVTMPAKCSPSQ